MEQSLTEPTYSIYRTVDRGELTLDKGYGKRWGYWGCRYGVIRHMHVVQARPIILVIGGQVQATKTHQCKIWRSQDDGLTWNVMWEGSQRERTCGFCF